MTTIRAIMSPRRFRSSMKRVAIMAPLGTQEPRWSCIAASEAGGRGFGVGVAVNVVVIPVLPIGW